MLFRSQEILARKVLIAYDDSRRIMTDASEVLTVINARSGGKPAHAEQASPIENA